MMQNLKKGFTLIELIAVIVIIISILILAIVSVSNVSKKNKEKAWEKVKKEVELAAKDYYDINNYKLGGISDSTSYARISVKKLVEEDYLNSVTNPVTGKNVNPCSYVEVTLVKNKFTYKYNESSSDRDCDVEEVVEIKEVGGPLIDVKMSSSPTGNNSYYIEPVNVEAYVNENNNGVIKEIKYSFNNEEYILTPNDQNIYVVPAIDGNKVEVKFVATNIYNRSATKNIIYYKDTENPICKSNNGSETWTNKDRTITQVCEDMVSGCNSVDNKFKATFKETLKVGNIKITDKAGNKTSCTVNVYVDKTPPKCGSNTGSTTWTNKDRTITQNCTDEHSGCDSVAKTYKDTLKKDKITIMDKAQNTNTCDVNVYVDKEKPKCSVIFDGTEGLNNWYITDNVGVNISKKDETSGISEYGLTTNNSTTYNKTDSGTQTKRTAGTKWYGYVKDKAGNENECSKTVKLEKDVEISFNTKKTNETKSVNPGNKSDGKLVFDTENDACGYGECSNVKCYKDNDKTKICDEEYFARACMYVKTYPRYFNVSSADTGENASVSVVDLVDKDYDNSKTSGLKRITSLNRFDCQNDWGSKYYYKNCGNSDGSGRNDFSAHVYQYITESGLGSNKIRLYTEYKADCNY